MTLLINLVFFHSCFKIIHSMTQFSFCVCMCVILLFLNCHWKNGHWFFSVCFCIKKTTRTKWKIKNSRIHQNHQFMSLIYDWRIIFIHWISIFTSSGNNYLEFLDLVCVWLNSEFYYLRFDLWTCAHTHQLVIDWSRHEIVIKIIWLCHIIIIIELNIFIIIEIYSYHWKWKIFTFLFGIDRIFGTEIEIEKKIGPFFFSWTLINCEKRTNVNAVLNQKIKRLCKKKSTEREKLLSSNADPLSSSQIKKNGVFSFYSKRNESKNNGTFMATINIIIIVIIKSGSKKEKREKNFRTK